jgi:hypothetical protein
LRNEQFDLATQLAELKDLPKLYRSLATVLTDLYSAFKRGSISKREFERLHNYPGHWLTYRYGIMPLVLSIYDVIRTLADKDEFRFFTDSVSGQVGDEITLLNFTNTSGTFSQTGRHTVTKQYNIKGCARLYYKDGRPKIVSDFAITAWELLPLSFVIDWVINVGRVLASRAAVSGSSAYDLSQNFLCTVKNTYSSTASHGGPAIIATANHGWTVEYIHKIRRPSQYLPKLDVGFDMNWRQYADAFALSLQLLSKIAK